MKVYKIKPLYFWALYLIAFISLLSLVIFIDLFYDTGKGIYAFSPVFEINLSDFSDCYYLPLFSTANCVTQVTNSYYHYNMSNHNFTLSYNILKKEGGTCRHWAYLNAKVMEELGYPSKLITIDGSQVAHAISIAYNNKSNYCIFDLNHIDCYA